jgi:NTP pyrophosphatase (non-canonical NTP hydrolase)
MSELRLDELIQMRRDLRQAEERIQRLGVLDQVVTERARQDAKWGVHNHAPIVWLARLMEEVGEAAQAALPLVWGGKGQAEYRGELVQVAAVAVAAIESLDRAAGEFPV